MGEERLDLPPMDEVEGDTLEVVQVDFQTENIRDDAAKGYLTPSWHPRYRPRFYTEAYKKGPDGWVRSV